ncbi:MAG: tyrosine-type recombinase/integrase [Chloroflexota bacterium]|nr:tyrosine-type recombinase/integrase [Chloroflexota bacterium]
MTETLATTRQSTTLTSFQELTDKAREYAGQAKAPNTKRAYSRDWEDFVSWCGERDLVPLPASPDVVALYLTDLAGRRRPSTLQRRISAISKAHKMAGHDTPTASEQVKVVMAGIRRTHGTVQEGKAPMTIEMLRTICEQLGQDLQGKRDRALLLVGFAGAFRRSELVSLTVSDVRESSDGLILTLRYSKTDQEGAGRNVGIPYGSNPDTCPVRALKAWLGAAGIDEGPLFRGVDRHGNVSDRALSGRAIALIVKRCVEAIGLDPDSYAGHSLRAGLATSAAAAGVSERIIMKQTGHKSEKMVRKYIREGSLFRDNAAAQVGL